MSLVEAVTDVVRVLDDRLAVQVSSPTSVSVYAVGNSIAERKALLDEAEAALAEVGLAGTRGSIAITSIKAES